ncbi:helix-turn-helix domain-containing protein [Streptomyces sp. NPDC054855]
MVRYYRRKHGNRSAAVVAGLCGISERYLHLVEAGKRIPSVEVLARLAVELDVPVAALFAEAPIEEPETPHTAAPAIARALTVSGPTPHSGQVLPPAQLREGVEQAWRIWQSSQNRFTQAARILPALIAEVEEAARILRYGSDLQARREVLRVAADLYGLLRSYCRRANRLDLSLLAADRALRAAEDADDPLRIAIARWNLGHVMLSRTETSAAEEAKEIALLAAEQLRLMPVSLESQAVTGALELVAVVADARCRRWWEARERLEDRAAPLASRVGEGNVQWTVFGPTNVALHAMSIEMLAGDAKDGLRVADQVDTGQLPSRERQFTFGLQAARCHDLRREDAAVLKRLLGLEELAPEDMERSPLARDMVVSLQKRARPAARRQVNALAERLQLA